MRPSLQSTDPSATLRNLSLIRAALVFGVSAFGVVIWVVHQKSLFPAQPPDPILGYAQIGVAIAALAFALITRARVPQATEVSTLASRLLICWAVGEGAALFGGVVFLLGGDLRPYLIGLVAMFSVLALTPIPRR
jgi:hypothetical protein